MATRQSPFSHHNFIAVAPKLELPPLRVALLTHLKQTLNLVAAVGLEPTTYGL
jgi:hypothetical protein